MINLNNFIQEKLKLNKDIDVQEYKYFPKDKKELQEILKERLKEDENANLNDIDVSDITDMDGLFSGLEPHNIDISKWNVSNVNNMNSVFFDCEDLDCDISEWDVSKVERMNYTFYNCINFYCDLSKWDVNKVRRWNGVFDNSKMNRYDNFKPKFNLKNLKH